MSSNLPRSTWNVTVVCGPLALFCGIPGRRFGSVGKTIRAHNRRRIWRRLNRAAFVCVYRSEPWSRYVRFPGARTSRVKTVVPQKNAVAGDKGRAGPGTLPSDSDRSWPFVWSPWLRTPDKSRGGGGDETSRLDKRTPCPTPTADRGGWGGGDDGAGGKRRILMRPEMRWRHKHLCNLDDTEWRGVSGHYSTLHLELKNKYKNTHENFPVAGDGDESRCWLLAATARRTQIINRHKFLRCSDTCRLRIVNTFWLDSITFKRSRVDWK